MFLLLIKDGLCATLVLLAIAGQVKNIANKNAFYPNKKCFYPNENVYLVIKDVLIQQTGGDHRFLHLIPSHPVPTSTAAAVTCCPGGSDLSPDHPRGTRELPPGPPLSCCWSMHGTEGLLPDRLPRLLGQASKPSGAAGGG